MSNQTNSHSSVGQSWDGVQGRIFTQEEIAVSKLRVKISGEISQWRINQNISVKQLSQKSGVSPRHIRRMEKLDFTVPLSEVEKVLQIAGFTLTVIPMPTPIAEETSRP